MTQLHLYNSPFLANSTFLAVNPFTLPLLDTQIALPSGWSSNFSSVFGNGHGQCVGLSTHASVPGHRYLLHVAIQNQLLPLIVCGGEWDTVIEVPPVPIAVAGNVGAFCSALLTSAATTTPTALEHLLEELAELGCHQ
jgi:hypothetical protein